MLAMLFILDNAVSCIVSLHMCLSNMNLSMRSVLIGTFAIYIYAIVLYYSVFIQHE